MEPIFAECFYVSGLVPTIQCGYHHHVYFTEDKAEVPRGAVTVTPWLCWGLHPLWTLASWKAMPSRDVLEAWHFLLAPHVPSPLCGGCVCPQSQRFFGAQDCEDQSPGLTLWTASV